MLIVGPAEPRAPFAFICANCFLTNDSFVNPRQPPPFTMMADITNGSGGSKPTNTGGAARACAAASVKPREDAKSAELKGADYFEVEKIGSGAYGAISGVYNDDGELFARKTFDEADDTSIDIGSLREISILRLLTGDLAHRFIVQPLDFYFEEKDDALCMIMPKAVGSLQDVLARKLQLEKNGGKPRIAHQLLTALTFLHDNGIMHRDVKPDNVLLNEAMEPILCDFSLAKFVDCRYSDPTHSGDVGTAVYMAPEVRTRVRACVYACACACMCANLRGLATPRCPVSRLSTLSGWGVLVMVASHGFLCRCTKRFPTASSAMRIPLELCCLNSFRVLRSSAARISRARNS